MHIEIGRSQINIRRHKLLVINQQGRSLLRQHNPRLVESNLMDVRNVRVPSSLVCLI